MDLAKGKGSVQRESLLPYIESLKLIHWNRLRCLMSSFKQLPCWLKTKVRADLMKEATLLRMYTNLLPFLTLRPVLFRRRFILCQIMLGGMYTLRLHLMWESFSNRTPDTCRLPSQPFPLRQLQLKDKLAKLKEAPLQILHHNPVRLRCLNRCPCPSLSRPLLSISSNPTPLCVPALSCTHLAITVQANTQA